MNSIPWELIIETVVLLVRECMANGQPEEALREQIRRPRGVARLRIERQTRLAMGIGPVKWLRERDTIMPQVYAEAEAMRDEDVEEILDRARAEENAPQPAPVYLGH